MKTTNPLALGLTDIIERLERGAELEMERDGVDQFWDHPNGYCRGPVRYYMDGLRLTDKEVQTVKEWIRSKRNG